MARIPKIDLESHFFTPEYMALLDSRTTPPTLRGHRRERPGVARAVAARRRAHAQPPAARDAARPERGAHRGDGPGGYRDPVPQRLEPGLRAVRGRGAGRARAQGERRARGLRRAAPDPLRRPRQPAGLSPARGGGRARALHHRARLQGRQHPLAHRRHLSRRRAVLPDPRARGARSRCRSTSTRRSRTRTCSRPYLGYGWAMPGPGLGFGHETAVHAMRIIYSGAFDKLPDLELILGHFGEGLMHWLYRVDFDFNKPWMAKSHRADDRAQAERLPPLELLVHVQRQLAGLGTAGHDPRGRRRPRHVRERLSLGADRGRRRLHRGGARSARTTEGRFAMATRSDSSASASRARGDSGEPVGLARPRRPRPVPRGRLGLHAEGRQRAPSRSRRARRTGSSTRCAGTDTSRVDPRDERATTISLRLRRTHERRHPPSRSYGSAHGGT